MIQAMVEGDAQFLAYVAARGAARELPRAPPVLGSPVAGSPGNVRAGADGSVRNFRHAGLAYSCAALRRMLWRTLLIGRASMHLGTYSVAGSVSLPALYFYGPLLAGC